MKLPPFGTEMAQVVFGGNQQLANAVYGYFEGFQIAALVAVVLLASIFYATMGFRIYFAGNEEAKKKLKLKMYTPLHAMLCVALSLVAIQFIWNILVPTIAVFIGEK